MYQYLTEKSVETMREISQQTFILGGDMPFIWWGFLVYPVFWGFLAWPTVGYHRGSIEAVAQNLRLPPMAGIFGNFGFSFYLKFGQLLWVPMRESDPRDRKSVV